MRLDPLPQQHSPARPDFSRWNTTMATPIEAELLAIGRKHLARQG
jgi:hypothetical protein